MNGYWEVVSGVRTSSAENGKGQTDTVRVTHNYKPNLLLNRSQSGKINTTVYRKQTATNSLLHYTSFHPTPLKKGIPIGQYLRLWRNCTDIDEFKIKAVELRERFLYRSYPRKCLKKAYQRALGMDRSELLRSDTRIENNLLKEVRYIGTFSNQWAEIKSIMTKHWDILRGDPDLRDVLPSKPTMVARRALSLSDTLVHSHFVEKGLDKPAHFLTPTIGSYRCHNCEACQYVKPMKTFKHLISGKNYEIRQFINCRTSGVIYAAVYNCPKMYIGKTFRELRRRILEHVGTIVHRKDTPIARHMRDVHNADPRELYFFGIEKVKLNERKGNIDNILLKKECQGIFRLKTRSPEGLNEGFTFTPFISKN
uniref:Helix-turn-helix domain-containing protein n=2 Tax=Xenopus tropicalis TaxID=8364 RepID=A0A1B8XYI2_XENTR